MTLSALTQTSIWVQRLVSGTFCSAHTAAEIIIPPLASRAWLPLALTFALAFTWEKITEKTEEGEGFYESKWNFIIYCVTHAWQHCRAKYLMVVFLLVRHLHEAIFPKLPCICVFLSLELAHLLSEWWLHGAFIVNCWQWIQRLEENLILKSCTLTFCTTQPKHI